MRPHWIIDGEVYCEQCAPADVEGDLNSNETDTPQNCCQCSRLCEYCLTEGGVRYVLETLVDALADGIDTGIIDEPGDYYHGSRQVEILVDWAKDLRDYSLNKTQQFIVDTFLTEATKP